MMESTDLSADCRKPHLPPGFRFHPTDEELVVHYLKKKAAAAPLPVAIIAEVDLYKFDPWELPAKAVFGEQEWYFFSPRDRKYPNGARPNRAATSGYWKATGTDKPVLTASGTQKAGVKKALVFYRGKPPKGIKTNWIMHEYRLVDHKAQPLGPPSYDPARNGSLRLDEWVLCRIYKRNNSSSNNNNNSAYRPLDHERYTTIEASLDLVPKSNYNSFLETEHDFYNHQQDMAANIGTVAANGMHVSSSPPSPQFPFMAVDPTILPGKRALHNLYWDGEERTRRSDVAQNSEPGGNNSIANILSQLSESPGLRPHVPIGNNNGGEPYQVSGSGVNWYN